MKIPYGISNFKTIRQENYLYIDKTPYIHRLESYGRYLFFIRPRRFGKSLFLSTLEHYYDLNRREEFEPLFGGLEIGRCPSAFKNTYLILKLNFSALNTSGKMELKTSFRQRLRNAIEDFTNRYVHLPLDFPAMKKRLDALDDCPAILETFLIEVKKTAAKIYLIIDEYDHFANDLIAMGDTDYYRELVRASGFVRDFYEAVKIGTETVIDRIFVTGISPLMLDNLTSGFNITTNITMSPLFNEMLGFTTVELTGALEQLGLRPEEQIFERLKEFYNGYLFNEDRGERLYNPDMVLYYVNHLLQTNAPPRELLDDNVKTDYGRLSRLAANETNREVLEEIIRQEYILAPVVSRFPFERMNSTENFISLLFYLGMLTIDHKDPLGFALKIPNYAIKTLYWEYVAGVLRKEYTENIQITELQTVIRAMMNGKIEPLLDYVTNNIFAHLSNRDLIKFDEKYIKVILLACLSPNNVYRIYSETETEHGYIDLYLAKNDRVPETIWEWLVELKYLKKANLGQLERVKTEGWQQLEKYAVAKNMTRENVKKVLVIFVGKDEYRVYE